MKTKDTVLSVVRHALTFLGGLAVAKGWFSTETLGTLVPAVIALAGVVWGAVDEFKAANNKPQA